MDKIEIHPDAVAITAFRALSDGSGRQYSATTFPRDPWQGVERAIRMGRAVGHVRPSSADDYAVLDLLNEDGDVVQDFGIATAQAFRWMKKRYHWTVEA